MSQNLSSAAVVIGALRVNSFLPTEKFCVLFSHLLFLVFFSKSTFFGKLVFGKTVRVSNSLDPDQACKASDLIWGLTVCKN